MSGEEALGYKPSKYQEKIFDFIVHGNGNCVISACAGSGKTSTCIASLKLIDKKRKCLFLAFNKSIASEISNKLNGVENVDVRTSHSLGLAIIKDNVNNPIEIDEYKYRTYIKSNIIELTDDEELKEIKKRKLTSIIDNVSQLVDLSRLNMCQTSKEIRCIADKYGIPILFDEDKIVEKVLYWGLSVLDRIDYTDMLWFPIELSMNTSKFKKDFIFIDECQDQSLLSIELFLKCFKRGTRFVAVGDEKQCQPKGTKILLSNGQEKNIEDLKVGDKLVSYNVKSSCKFKGYYSSEESYKRNNIYADEVTEIESHIADKIIKIKTQNGFVSAYTPEHICYSRFNINECFGKYVLYIMVDKRGYYRIGITQLFKNGGTHFGLSNRMVVEKCNRAWILDIYDNDHDARVNEILYSMKYQIPQIIFNVDHVNSNKNVKGMKYGYEDIDYIYKELGDLTPNVKKCLEEFHRDFNFPFHILNDNTYRHSKYHISEIRACNLFPKYMEVGTFLGETRNRTHGLRRPNNKEYRLSYDVIDKIEYEYSKPVYSINVSGNNNYVADKILTHNCINAFAGASEEAFKFMCDYKNTVVFELPVCYRCPRKVIALAKDFTTNIIERDGVDEGNIIYGNSLLNVQEGDMVLCRTKSPLLLAYTMLISNGIKCYIAGREYEQKLKKTISKIKEEQLNKDLKDVGLFAMLYDELFNERNNIMRKTGLDYRDATLSPYIRDIYDIIKSLEVISNDITTKEELMARLEEVFKEDVDSVVLSTIHKSKGLEANNVHILCKSSMPMKSAKKDWEIASEENLIYVAYTRAKKTLTFISEKEIKPFGAIDNPDAILEELELIENVVCKLLDKEPINQADKVQLSRFNISSGLTKIELNIIDENKVELGSVKNFNNIDDSDLLNELEELM